MSTQTYPTPTSPLYQIACDYMRAANKLDFDALASLMADDFLQQINPSSIRTPGNDAPVTKEQYIARGKQMLGGGGFLKEINVSPACALARIHEREGGGQRLA